MIFAIEIIFFYGFNHLGRNARPLGQQDIDGIADRIDHKKDKDADADRQHHHENQPSDNESNDAHNKCPTRQSRN